MHGSRTKYLSYPYFPCYISASKRRVLIYLHSVNVFQKILKTKFVLWANNFRLMHSFCASGNMKNKQTNKWRHNHLQASDYRGNIRDEIVSDDVTRVGEPSTHASLWTMHTFSKGRKIEKYKHSLQKFWMQVKIHHILST